MTSFFVGAALVVAVFECLNLINTSDRQTFFFLLSRLPGQRNQRAKEKIIMIIYTKKQYLRNAGHTRATEWVFGAH